MLIKFLLIIDQYPDEILKIRIWSYYCMSASREREIKLNVDLNLKLHGALQDDPKTAIDTLLRQAQNLGLVINKKIVIDYDTPTKKFSSNPDNKIVPPVGAKIFPCCQAGENRSQVTRIILNEMKKNHPEYKWDVASPHGAEGSIDPFILPTMSPDELLGAGEDFFTSPAVGKQMAYQYHEISGEPDFEKCFKQERSPRLLEEKFFEKFSHFDRRLTTRASIIQALQKRDVELLTKMREFADEELFFKEIIQNKGHLICFERATHDMLFRLVEVATRKGIGLDGVVIYPISTFDPIVMKSPSSFCDVMCQILQGPPVLTHQETKAVLPTSTSTHQLVASTLPPAPTPETKKILPPAYEPVLIPSPPESPVTERKYGTPEARPSKFAVLIATLDRRIKSLGEGSSYEIEKSKSIQAALNQVKAAAITEETQLQLEYEQLRVVDQARLNNFIYEKIKQACLDPNSDLRKALSIKSGWVRSFGESIAVREVLDVFKEEANEDHDAQPKSYFRSSAN